jgi:hypothetical protein
MGIIDFREIVSAKADHASVLNAPIGTSALPDDFETFCLEFFTSLRGMTIFEQIARGADNGIDLGVEETRADGSRIRWLVSCKHKAHSNAAVTEDEEKNILERLYKWECDGFIPFYTSSPSAKVKSNIEGVAKAGKRVDWHLKDRIERELLGSAEGVRMAARYFPKSLVNHYSTFIATMQTYSASDVVVDDDGVASIAGIRHVLGGSDDDIAATLAHLARTANVFDTMDAHEPYFVKALNDAISLAPDFFDGRTSPVTLADVAHVSPTWCSFSLYRASIDRKNGRALAFACFVAAVWSFWDYARAHRVFAEMRAFRGSLSRDDVLTPDQVARLRASAAFKEAVEHHMAQGYLSVGLVGITLEEQMRDIVTRLFAYTNPIPDPVGKRTTASGAA